MAKMNLNVYVLSFPDYGLRYLLWSDKHQAWWRPDAMGYTENRDEAGRYNIAEAVQHVAQSADCGVLEQVTRMVVDPSGTVPSVPVPPEPRDNDDLGKVYPDLGTPVVAG